MKIMIRRILPVMALMCFIHFAKAQDTVLTQVYHGKLDSLRSTVLNQTRLVQIFTPENYKPGSSEKYDVLYVLDGGNWNTGLIKQIQRFVEGEAYMPPTIIVSVMGIDRNKDLTPTHLPDWTTSGGANNFLKFIKTELMPYVNKNYPSNNQNTLWGHSLGGLFVTYAMLTDPDMFRSYIAADPSLWWDKVMIPKMVATKLPALAGKGITFFMTYRDDEDGKGMKPDTMQAVLRQYAPAGFKWKAAGYKQETHSSLRLKTTYEGLKYTYEGFTDAIEFFPQGGIIEKGKPLPIRYFEETTSVRYTLDGSVPTINSKPIQSNEILITEPATFSIKKFANRSAYDRAATGTFTATNNLRSYTSAKKLQPGGLNYAYYEGNWGMWPDLKNIKPTKTGIADKDFDVERLPSATYALVMDGLIACKEDGYYLFLMNADKGTKMYVGDKLIIDWDGTYKRRTNTYIVPLKKGFYPIRIEHLRKRKDFKLEWGYIIPSKLKNMDSTPVPYELQYGHK